jgi:hypothetical protein
MWPFVLSGWFRLPRAWPCLIILRLYTHTAHIGVERKMRAATRAILAEDPLLHVRQRLRMPWRPAIFLISGPGFAVESAKRSIADLVGRNSVSRAADWPFLYPASWLYVLSHKFKPCVCTSGELHCIRRTPLMRGLFRRRARYKCTACSLLFLLNDRDAVGSERRRLPVHTAGKVSR